MVETFLFIVMSDSLRKVMLESKLIMITGIFMSLVLNRRYLVSL